MRDPMYSPPSSVATAAFELPCVTHALELLRELRTDWVGWIENGLDGTFVVVLAPERIGELNQLMSRVGTWITAQDFLAIRFHLEGRAYIMHRGGSVGPADRSHASDN
jgi:hypothetical protein